jgi:hypothetical protein
MINLLSQQKKTEVKNILLSRFFTIIFFVLSFSFIVLTLSLIPIYAHLNKQSADVDALLGKLNKNAKYSQAKNSFEVINDANNKAKLFPNEMPKNGRIESVLSRIVALKDSNIRLNSFSYSGGESGIQTIKISGVASNRKALIDFKERLSNEKGFSDIVLPISSFVKVENIEFTINLKSN